MFFSGLMKDKKAFFLFFCAFLIYIGALAKIHATYGQDVFDFVFWAENGIVFPEINDYGEYFRCSRHIATTCIGYLFYRLWILFDWGKGAMIPLQTISVLFGAGGVLVFYWIVQELFKDKKFCFIVSLFFAFSYIYWFFSIEPLQVMPALFFRLIGILLLLKIYKLRWQIFLLMGLAHSISILFDSQGFLFLPIMVYGIFLFYKKEPKGILFKMSLVYIGTVILITGITFFSIGYFYFHYNSLGVFLEFIKGGVKAFRIDGKNLQEGLGNLFQSLSIVDNYYLRGNNILHLVMNSIIFSSFLGALVYLVNIRKKINKKFSRILLFSIVWFSVFFPFYSLKDTRVLEFYVYLLTPIWLILAIAIWHIGMRIGSNATKLKIFNYSMILLLGIFISHNFIYGIMPLCDYRNDERYEQFMFLKQHYNHEESLIVLTNRYNYFCQNIRYLNRLTGNNIKTVLRANYRVQGGPDHYRQLSMLARKKESILLFFSPAVFKEQQKEIKVSDIIAKIEEGPEGTYSYLVQDLLDDLYKEYKFVPIVSSSKLECSIISLTKKHDK